MGIFTELGVDKVRLTGGEPLLRYLCLYAQNGIDLRKPLRGGASKEEIKSVIVAGWTQRRDRGAEERKALRSRGVFVPIEGLKKDPHLEMHTRGG